MSVMHADELPIDAALVRLLLRRQFPAWCELPLARYLGGGTDNAIFRLGDALAVRLPLIGPAAGQVEKEAVWLPRLAPHLPIAIPEPLAHGNPEAGYPYSWAVYRWLPGKDALSAPLADSRQAALDMAGFIMALQACPPPADTGARLALRGRGGPLAPRDAAFRAALEQSKGLFDVDSAAALWQSALAAPPWTAAGRWLHADLHPANLLTVDGRLSAIIDWGSLTIGDPATDLIAAWAVFDAAGREILRTTLGTDEAMWRRGQGWAVSMAAIALPYYLDTNPVLVAIARRILTELLGPGAVA